jgi:hypothetical protein
MSKTSIRIEKGLKAYAAAVAALAEQRWEAILATGKTVPWEAARSYLQARARGEHPRKPAARKFKI